MEHHMRIVHLLAVPFLAALIVAPTAASAQARISISFGARLGPDINVSAYSSERLGDWRMNYRRWTPVRLYDVNGRYYLNNVRGSRPVLVYRYDNEYFLPPQDRAWDGMDRRYNYRQRPIEADYNRARPYERYDTPDRRLGNEVGVAEYSQDRAGDWRTNMRRWSPVVMYEVNGRYYPNSGAGGRPVAMYRYQNEYFLPPDDQAWVGSDRRYDYRHQPDRNDRNRARNLGPQRGR
jgi:hypothetical protein